MDFMTMKEAACKWEVTERMVQHHDKAGRISGAVKLAGVLKETKNCRQSKKLMEI